jgi:N-hydroxyarylamine O-acetyltransferase
MRWLRSTSIAAGYPCLSSAVDVPRYLERIALAGAEPQPTRAWLERLITAHLLTVPFENLDIAAGRPISIEPDAIFAKVVDRRRGGFCYELNGLFGLLLREIGFRVSLLSGRTVGGVHGELGPEFDHLVLLVELDGPWLVDVGWGEGYRRPVSLVDGVEHEDPGIGTYRVVRNGGLWDVLERIQPGGEAEEYVTLTPANGWRVLYRFDLVSHRLAEFRDACRWQETESPFFPHHRLCTIATPDGRRTLMDERLIVRAGGTRTERLVTEDEVPMLLEELFGVVL